MYESGYIKGAAVLVSRIRIFQLQFVLGFVWHEQACLTSFAGVFCSTFDSWLHLKVLSGGDACVLIEHNVAHLTF